MMNKIFRIVLLIFSIGIALYASSYFSFKVQGFLFLKEDELLTSLIYRTIFYFHVLGGVIALLVGPWQFFPKLRNRKLSLHRLLGRIYVYSVFVGSLCGFIVAFFAYGGLANKIGFAIAALLWFYFTVKGFVSVRAKDIDNHQKWMIRSFAMSAFAITLRIWLGVGEGLIGLDFLTTYRIAAWVFILNLVFAELIIRGFHPKK